LERPQAVGGACARARLDDNGGGFVIVFYGLREGRAALAKATD
jgi:hypothetical protein